MSTACTAATFEGSGCRGTITDGQCSEQDDHHPTPGMLPYDGPGAGQADTARQSRVISTWERSMRGYLGKRVTVRLTDPGTHPPATVTGVLHEFDDEGQVRLFCDDGAFHWCWPALAMQLAEPPADTGQAPDVAAAVLAAAVAWKARYDEMFDEPPARGTTMRPIYDALLGTDTTPAVSS